MERRKFMASVAGMLGIAAAKPETCDSLANTIATEPGLLEIVEEKLAAMKPLAGRVGSFNAKPLAEIVWKHDGVQYMASVYQPGGTIRILFRLGAAKVDARFASNTMFAPPVAGYDNDGNIVSGVQLIAGAHSGTKMTGVVKVPVYDGNGSQLYEMANIPDWSEVLDELDVAQIKPTRGKRRWRLKQIQVTHANCRRCLFPEHMTAGYKFPQPIAAYFKRIDKVLQSQFAALNDEAVKIQVAAMEEAERIRKQTAADAISLFA